MTPHYTTLSAIEKMKLAYDLMDQAYKTYPDLDDLFSAMDSLDEAIGAYSNPPEHSEEDRRKEYQEDAAYTEDRV